MTKIDDIKDNANLIPLLGAYFILYGSIDLLAFYGKFNISIIHYINFSEIIVYFIRDIYTIIAHIIILLPVIIGFYSLIPKAVGNLDKETTFGKIIQGIIKEEPNKIYTDTSVEYSEAKKQLKKDKKVLLSCIYILVLVILWSICEYGLRNTQGFIVPLVVSVISGCFITVKHFRLIIVIYGAVSLLTSAHFNAISRADNVKNGAHYGINVDMDGRLIQSDSSNYVIGKTENYLFYYESKLKKTTVYPTNKINYITIPDR